MIAQCNCHCHAWTYSAVIQAYLNNYDYPVWQGMAPFFGTVLVVLKLMWQ